MDELEELKQRMMKKVQFTETQNKEHCWMSFHFNLNVNLIKRSFIKTVQYVQSIVICHFNLDAVLFSSAVRAEHCRVSCNSDTACTVLLKSLAEIDKECIVVSCSKR